MWYHLKRKIGTCMLIFIIPKFHTYLLLIPVLNLWYIYKKRYLRIYKNYKTIKMSNIYEFESFLEGKYGNFNLNNSKFSSNSWFCSLWVWFFSALVIFSIYIYIIVRFRLIGVAMRTKGRKRNRYFCIFMWCVVLIRFEKVN